MLRVYEPMPFAMLFQRKFKDWNKLYQISSLKYDKPIGDFKAIVIINQLGDLNLISS